MNTKLKLLMLLVIGLFATYVILTPEHKIDYNENREHMIRSLLQSSDTIMLDGTKWYKSNDNLMGCKIYPNGHKEYIIIFGKE